MGKFIILGLGSNLGDREDSLARAVALLGELLADIKQSSLYENDALVSEGAPESWNIKFLNIVICGRLKDARITSQEFLAKIKEFESQLGRKPSERWAPRVIDIDILAWGDEVVNLPELTIPHKEMLKRDFVMKPLREILPNWLPPTQTKIIGILNITPDSFSDGGEFYSPKKAIKQAHEMLAQGAAAIDIGAESTRPGATQISSDEEIERLKPVLAALPEIPISIDTRNPKTAKFALKHQNVKYLNDVSGFFAKEMVQIAAESGTIIIVMHSLSVPADKNIILETPALPTLKNWITQKFAELTKSGIKPENIIFDPGIGFGKTPEQSRELINGAKELAETCHKMGAKILYGHSRKSFLRGDIASRDIETAKISAYLQEQGVDYIRVHNISLNNSSLTKQEVHY